MCYNLKNALCIIIYTSILCITLKNANGQEFRVRTVKSNVPEEKKDTIKLTRYDGVSPFFDLQELAKNPHYYDGERILFLPHSSHRYDYFGGFSLSTPTAIPDTIWSKDKKKIKKIEMVQCDVYKPVYVIEGKVHYFGETEKLDASVTLIESGYKTPISMIEGNVFTIIDCISNIEIKNGRWLILKMLLKDSDGVEIIWNTKINIGDKSDYRFMPILMYSYIEKYKKYIGGNFVDYRNFNVKEPSSIESVLDDVYECTELSYVEEKKIYEPGLSEIYFYSPVLFFMHKGEEVYYNIVPGKSFGWVSGKESINSIMDPTEFKRQAQYEIQKAKESEKLRLLELAKEEEEKKKADANRLSELTKKYGIHNAQLIMQSKVQIGMSKEMCIESWGEPTKINRTITSGSIHEQWVYYKSYLYFDDGILSGIQN